MTNKPIIIGTIGAPYGIKGWVKINSYTDPIENILDYLPWELHLGNQQKTVNLTQSKFHSKSLIGHIEGCNTPEEARLLTGAKIITLRNQLPKLNENEYYWSDLEGLAVSTVNGALLGKVDHVFATGSNDVIVVEGTKRYLIPFLLEQIIKNIDLENKIMIVDWDPDF